jgi:hypothetical protein
MTKKKAAENGPIRASHGCAAHRRKAIIQHIDHTPLAILQTFSEWRADEAQTMTRANGR